jgi:hypothetical protein
MRKLREKLQTNLFNNLWWMRKVGKMSKYCGGGPRTVFSIFRWRLMHGMDYCSSGSTDRLSIDPVTTISSCIPNSSGDAEWYFSCCHNQTSGCLFTTSRNHETKCTMLPKFRWRGLLPPSRLSMLDFVESCGLEIPQCSQDIM